MVQLKVEFLGGLSRCFNNETSAEITMDGESVFIGDLVKHITDNLLKSHADVFSSEGQLVSGVLALVNEVDWELLGGSDAVCKDGDKICFISTLHGG